MANQFVVELKNVPGGLATLAEALAARGIDLRAIGGGGIGDSGHIIMTTADDDGARAVLEAGGYTFIEGESILTEVLHQPPGLANRPLQPARLRVLGQHRTADVHHEHDGQCLALHFHTRAPAPRTGEANRRGQSRQCQQHWCPPPGTAGPGGKLVGPSPAPRDAATPRKHRDGPDGPRDQRGNDNEER